MWCRIVTHSQLNRVLQENYKYFQKSVKKMSKIDVSPQNEGLVPSKFPYNSLVKCIS